MLVPPAPRPRRSPSGQLQSHAGTAPSPGCPAPAEPFTALSAGGSPPWARAPPCYPSSRGSVPCGGSLMPLPPPPGGRYGLRGPADLGGLQRLRPRAGRARAPRAPGSWLGLGPAGRRGLVVHFPPLPAWVGPPGPRDSLWTQGPPSALGSGPPGPSAELRPPKDPVARGPLICWPLWKPTGRPSTRRLEEGPVLHPAAWPEPGAPASASAARGAPWPPGLATEACAS